MYRHAKGLSRLANWNKSPKYFRINRYRNRFGSPFKRGFVKRPLPITPYLKKGGQVARGAGYRGYFPGNRWQLLGAAAFAGYPYLRKGYKRFKRKYGYRRR